MTSYPAFSCPGHGQPCAVRTVTKAGSKHLGRPFYVCTASPQCTGWFQLADEPVRQPGTPLPSTTRQLMPGCLLSPSLSLPGKRVAVSIGTDVVVSATVCTDGGETQQKVQEFHDSRQGEFEKLVQDFQRFKARGDRDLASFVRFFLFI